MPSIENCDLRFRVECPKVWDSLTPTDDEAVRFCETCRKSVYLCHSNRDAVEHGREGHCVAVTLQAKLDRVRPPGWVSLMIMRSPRPTGATSPAPMVLAARTGAPDRMGRTAR